MHWFIAFLIVAPAFWLFLMRSTYLIDYLIWVTVFNRGIRRVVDWWEGAFNPFNAISLTPQVVGLLLVILVIQEAERIPVRMRWPLVWLGWALVWGLVVGLPYNKLAALYEFADYVVPIAAMLFAFLHGMDEKILDRWIRTIGWSGVIASIYGWYQYYTIPPWDAMWVRAVGFEGYLGSLAPTEMTVFSTFQERGPCATYLAWAAIPMLIHKRWRSRLSWAAPALIMSVVFLTYARTSLIAVGLTVALFPLLGRGRGTIKTGLLVGLIVLVAPLGLKLLPSAERVQDRLDTFQDISQDNSFQGRIAITIETIKEVAANPIGFGFGSTGNAGRINTGEIKASELATDGGYNKVLATFGFVGAPFFIYGMFTLYRELRNVERSGFATEKTVFMKAMFIMVTVTFYAGNMLAGTISLLFWLLLGHSLRPDGASMGGGPNAPTGRIGVRMQLPGARNGGMAGRQVIRQLR